ncbi:MAG: hypothetical protein IK004_05725 [Bacteroidales bacterium]|nr:hypothetical protein [Bacteroidales bacterium]
MKTIGIILKIALSAALLLICVDNTKAQDYSKAKKHPSKTEVILSTNLQTSKGYDSEQVAYKVALREAQRAYPEKNVEIRDMRQGDLKVNQGGSVSYCYRYTIVEVPSVLSQKLYDAITKATKDIEEGNRFALDNISVKDDNVDKEKTKGEIVDLLLKKGYKVVAKEHLAKLYKEQQGQQSGIYNEETTVEANKFTAVGYYLTVRITEEYVQIQVVNVSTGEFEGNVTENL